PPQRLPAIPTRRSSDLIVAGASVGVRPEVMGIGPVPAIQAVCDKAGIAVEDVDRFEINEAFGAQVMACMRALNIPRDKLNVNGGDRKSTRLNSSHVKSS